MKDNNIYKNILVISLQGIGDLLLATPLLRGLRSSCPVSKLTVLTFKTNAEILSHNPDVDIITAVGTGAEKDAGALVKLVTGLRKARPDLSICVYPSGLRSALLGYLSGARQRLGQDLSIFKGRRWLFTKQAPVKEVKHAILMNLDLLGLVGIDTSGMSRDPVLNLGEDDKKFAAQFLKDNGITSGDILVAIHAGGGKYTAAFRSWPAERFAKAADAAAEKLGAKIMLIGGPSDLPAVNSISGMMRRRHISAAGKASLMQTAALISMSRALVCNNSGPMHMAAALGVPTVSIFGSADPRIHRPYGQGHIVLRKELECSPCYYPFFRDTLPETKARNRWTDKKFKCAAGDYRCLLSVSPDDVLEALEKILGGRAGR